MDLYSAVTSGDLERMRLLVKQGADKDKGNSNGAPPLLLASCYGHLNVVQYLVEQGSKKDRADSGGFTPLDLWLQPKVISK